MGLSFKQIGLLGQVRNSATEETFQEIITLLSTLGLNYAVDQEVGSSLQKKPDQLLPASEIAKIADLVIVVGGDGSLLRAARTIVDHDVPLVGVNRGRFGFLADISPQTAKADIEAILNGEYLEETRFLLEVSVNHESKKHALNDIVLTSGNTAHMTEFEVYVDDVFMCSEHSDGMICATPTGSTAYALSGGGPIIHPASNTIVLVPMFSHSLNSRPIVLNANSVITFKVGAKIAAQPLISCDGETVATLSAGDIIKIQRKKQQLTLLHPKNYDYFSTLGRKLNWGRKLIHE